MPVGGPQRFHPKLGPFEVSLPDGWRVQHNLPNAFRLGAKGGNWMMLTPVGEVAKQRAHRQNALKQGLKSACPKPMVKLSGLRTTSIEKTDGDGKVGRLEYMEGPCKGQGTLLGGYFTAGQLRYFVIALSKKGSGMPKIRAALGTFRIRPLSELLPEPKKGGLMKRKDGEKKRPRLKGVKKI